MAKKTFHLIANAHLDPVWLWDWREGLNEGIITCRTILDLMDENPELTFIRGEAAIYEHIEKADPETFERIRDFVQSGRWDIVGGTYIQPDTNLPATETLARHYTRGKRYFADRFGKNVEVAWAADSFGHPAGLPEILASAGITSFAYTRPGSPVGSPAFWWEGPGGSKILAYRPLVGWYGSDRDELPRRLDELFAASAKSPVDNVGVFYGIGNHGGGPTRRQLADIAEWAAAHPEIDVVHSGLHRLFAALRSEIEQHGSEFFPTHKGELNYCLRGCYSSVAKYKYLYRRAEAAVTRAETTSTIIGSSLSPTVVTDQRVSSAWDTVLFNSFHDILPGSSIERAMDDQIAWLGSAIYESQGVELDALNALADNIDTNVPKATGDNPSAVSFIAWNPHPFPFHGPLEIEAALDYRPIWSYRNASQSVPYEIRDSSRNAIPYQRIPTEHASVPDAPWRVRSIVEATIQPFGWEVYTIGYTENAEKPAFSIPAVTSSPGTISNGEYTLEAKVGSSGISIKRNGEPVFGADGLSVITVEDPYGSWGQMAELPESLDLQDIRHNWTISRVETLETGPYRASLWVRLQGGPSTLDLLLSVSSERNAVDVSARLLIDDRSARIKLVMPVTGGESAIFDVPGAALTRSAAGEVPGGRWVSVPDASGGFVFASDALYNFNYKPDALQATIARGSRYAADVTMGPETDIWAPAVDRGELKFKFVLASGSSDPSQLAKLLESQPIILSVPAKPGPLERAGSLGRIEPSSLALQALKPADDGNGIVVRVHNASTESQRGTLVLAGNSLPLGEIAAGAIASWRVVTGPSGQTAERADSLT